MESLQLETKTKQAFGPMRDSPVEAPPFMKSRIMARLDEKSRLSRQVRLWKWATGLATGACAITAVVALGPWRTQPTQGSAAYLAMRPYVIHVDLGGERLAGARSAEVELPEGVHFVSKTHPEVAELRSMRLEVPEAFEGRSRLPFVVTSDKEGLARLKLKIFDDGDQLLQERVLSVRFAQGRAAGESEAM